MRSNQTVRSVYTYTLKWNATHYILVKTHLNQVSIGSDNDLSPIRRQVIM